MSTLILELADSGVCAWDGQAASLISSPGYALLEAGAVQSVGEDAYAQARLQPRAIHDRFWDELSLEPLASAAGSGQTAADLACEHLTRVWESLRTHQPKEVFLAVPGTYDREQLALVLGIAREAGLPVTGLIDAALAAVQATDPGRTLMHLDVHLHRALITRFTQGEQLSRAGVESTRGSGLRALRERWMGAIANAFVERTRFDPLHLAEHEQQLYQQLRNLSESIGDEGQLSLEISTSSATHNAQVDGQTLREAADQEYQRLLELVSATSTPGEALLLQLSHRAGSLPGLADLLGELPGVQVQVLGPDAVAHGTLALGDALRQHDAAQGVPYLTQVAWQQAGTAGASTPSAPPRLTPTADQVPTHVVYEGLAQPLSSTPLMVGVQVGVDGAPAIQLGAPLRGVSRQHCALALGADGVATITDHSTHGTWLNGHRIDGQATLRMGDRLRVGTPGHELHLVRVTS
ncbi:MAG: FHA domain-containing protein [Pseudomonadota bacterium]